jgi:hypothetical protein
MGSAAALAVAFVGFTRQISPMTCIVRAVAAFAVFAALGIILRYLLDCPPYTVDGREGNVHPAANEAGGETIRPGTHVGDLLNDRDRAA